MFRRRTATIVAALLMLPSLLALASVAPARAASGRAAVTHTTIQASGSSWAAIALGMWVSDESSLGLKVIYNPTGSAAGRADFATGTMDFAVSDIGYQGADPSTGANDKSSRPYAYLPIVGGGTAFPYNLTVNGQRVTNLRLSGLTLAKIFTNQITNWNDAAITQDNNGHALPSLPIVTVVHSEGSGTTAMFTRYLASMFPNVWGPFNGGQPVMVEYWPRQGTNQIAQNGSSMVYNYTKSSAANGAIGVDEYAYPKQDSWPVANIENSAGYFVLPSMYNDAVALTAAKINSDPGSPDYLLQDLDGVYRNPDPRTYPLSSYSYAIMPTSATDSQMAANGTDFPAKWQTLADFLDFSICQGQSSIGQAGYSALPINLVQAGFDQINKIKAAAPQVNITQANVSACNNPTFVAGHPELNHLAQIAPQPPACDKAGAGPCAGVTDANGNGGQGSNSGGGSSGTGGGTGGGGGSGGSAGAGGGGAGGSPSGTPSVNPITGQTVFPGVSSGNGSSAVPVSATLPYSQDHPVSGLVLGVLAALLLVGALIAPPLLAGRLSQHPGRRP